MKNDYVLIRHGQTYWNKSGIMHGQYDIPLNWTGFKQAQKVSSTLKNYQFDLCYCSPLKRAKSTADQILRHHRSTEVIYDSRLMELSKGSLEGAHVNSEKMLKAENSAILEKFKIEKKKEFFDRVAQLIGEIEKKHDNKKILIVAHSGTVKMIMFVINYPKEPLHKAYYTLHIKNCEPYIIRSTKNETSDMKIGFFPMVADILHAGHVLALEEAKKHCDLLIVGLHCKPQYKSPQQTIYQRYMQLRAVKWVDEVIPYENSEIDADIVCSLDFDVYFLGEDHKSKDWELKDMVEKRGKSVIYISRAHGYSSNRIKNDAK